MAHQAPLNPALGAHLLGGTTTLARAWAVERRDGWRMGFTDHDRDLSFAGTTYKANTGMTARALMQTTGLSIDNTEAVGALSDAAVTEADLRAGRFDGARVEAWLVNWADTQARVMLFRGSLGEVTRGAGAFEAEIEGLAQALNELQGHVYQTPCSAVLGDGRCGFDLSQNGFREERALEAVEDGVKLTFTGFDTYADRWFERGRLTVLSGAAAGLTAMIKNDRLGADERVVELWQELRAPLSVGDMLRFEAGCDKQVETCRLKFNNFLNFRGFPDIPGEDWLTTFPRQVGGNTRLAGQGGGTE